MASESKFTKKFNALINYKGAMAATVVPFNDDGSVNHEMFNAYADHLIDIGVGGVYINGSNGEGLSLSADERVAVTRDWFKLLKSKKPDMIVVACVSSTVAVESVEHARIYSTMDVDAISVLPPIYHRPDNMNSLISYFQAISKAAPDLPLLLYHYPTKSFVSFDLREFFEKAKNTVPTLAGMKYSHNDMAQISSLGTEIRSRLAIFNGFIECLLPMASMGVNACVSGTFNLRDAVAKYHSLLGNLPVDLKAAGELQNELNEIQKSIKRGNPIYNVKKATEKETNGIVKLGKPRAPIYVNDD